MQTFKQGKKHRSQAIARSMLQAALWLGWVAIAANAWLITQS